MDDIPVCRDWATRLSDICVDLTSGTEDGELLRRLYVLLRSAPDEVRDELGILCPSTLVDIWLGADAQSQVAINLLGRAGYMISRGSNGTVMATVVSGNVIRESIAEGETEAQAICSALASGLMDWSRRTGLMTGHQVH